MKNYKIAKQLIKIAKEIIGVRINMVFDFSYQKKVFVEFKKQHPRLTCEFYQNGAQSYWKISDDKKTSIIDFDYFEKADSYHGVYILNGEQYSSLQKALEALKFGIDFDNDQWFENLDKKTKHKIINFLIEKEGEKFIFHFSGKPYKAKELITEYIIQPIQKDYQNFVYYTNINEKIIGDKQLKIIKEISQNKNVLKNVKILLHECNRLYKFDLNGFILPNGEETLDEWYQWINYEKKDWLQGGKYYDIIEEYFYKYLYTTSIPNELQQQINKIVGY